VVTDGTSVLLPGMNPRFLLSESPIVSDMHYLFDQALRSNGLMILPLLSSATTWV